MIPVAAYKWLVYAGIAAALWAGHAYVAGRALDAREQAVVKRYTDAKRDAALAAMRVGERLQESANKLQEAQNAKTETDRLRIAALTASLRNRAARPATMPADTSPAKNCTGARLYRDDGQFLAWYASEASRTARALERCEAQYNEVRGAK
jgi:vacuolar-type H+-ATPase catalytic subunit A/Vma1